MPLVGQVAGAAARRSWWQCACLRARAAEVKVAGGAGEAEGGRAEAQRQDLVDVVVDLGVQVQVAAGDSDIEDAAADVHGDVTGTEVEELHVVVGVDHDQFAVVAALDVAGLQQHGRGGFGQGSLVGKCYTQHGAVLFSGSGGITA